MRRITARRIITDMQHTDAFWAQFSLIGKPNAGCEFVGNPVRATDFSVPLYTAMAVGVPSRSYKRPAYVRLPNRHMKPKPFAVSNH
jgi:hypothetical protein